MGMSISEIIATYKCEPEVEEILEIALSNSGVKFGKRLLEDGEYKLYIPSVTWALSILLNIFNEYKDKINGTIEIPDGTTAEITQQGIQQLQSLLVESMSQTDRVLTPVQQYSDVSPWIIYRNEIGEIIKSIPDWLSTSSKYASTLKNRVVLALLILIVMTIGVISWLTIIGEISGEALIFLCGTLIGYIFAFLQKYLGLIQTS